MSETDNTINEFDDNLDFMLDNEFDDYKEPESWNIITALDRVLSLSFNSELDKEFWEKSKNPMDFLTKELGLTKIQVVILAILVEEGDALSWRGIGKHLNCSRLTIMTYSEEVEDLVAKRWLVRKVAHEFKGSFEGFAVAQGVVTSLRHNKPFIPEKIDGLDIQTFVDKIDNFIERSINSDSILKDTEDWLTVLCKANPQLPLCHVVMGYEDDIHIQSLLLLTVADYAQWGGTEDEGLTMGAIDDFYQSSFCKKRICKQLRDGSHPLIMAGLIEQKCEDGIANPNQYVLTRVAKENLLDGYDASRPKSSKIRPDRSLKSHAGIKKKDMFYNAKEKEQIDRLTNLLSKDNFSSIQERLSQEGMRKGFACLFYGAPGTGKTETVLQIARQTGRDIMQIDIAGMRDKFVGESEKNIKAVFGRYRKICKQSEVTPILFFNEADGIFGKRSSLDGRNPSVEKMDNAMQNIILQELEDLDGILIATTNLTCNLDSAFERRFLFKIEFRNPETDVKAKLWKSMLGDDISSEDAMKLATKYDFSGGQIENIARQRTIDYILSGKQDTVDDLDTLCQSELINNNSTRRAIGFAS